MSSKPHLSSLHVAGIFGLLLLAYHLIFREFIPLPNGRMGHDYILTLAGFLDGFLWYRHNGFVTPPWFSPSFCGGQALFADPQSAFYSIPQFLTFVVDPLQAVYWAFLLFAALGFWGMYLFARHCLTLERLPAVVAAIVFMFNGFYAHRMIVGHYGYQAFMLVPMIALLLMRKPETRLFSARGLTYSLLAGLLIAYWFHSGLTTLMIPAALAVTCLACLAAFKTPEGTFKAFFSRGILALVPVFGLAASKLNANLTLMSRFSRDFYPLPGIDNPGELLEFVVRALFYSSENAYRMATPLWKNIQWSAMPHELAYGVTPIPLAIMVIGLGAVALGIRHQPEHSPRWRRYIVPGVILGSILFWPLAMLYYSPEWNAVLKSLPLIGSTTSPFRWLIIYIPCIAAVSGIAVANAGRARSLAAALAIIGIPMLNFLEVRSYYQMQDHDPGAVVAYYKALRAGDADNRIVRIGAQQMPDNAQLAEGTSPMRCYNPIYGYRLEKLGNGQLFPGPVDAVAPDGSLNLTNPACLLFPDENQCQLWDRFKAGQHHDAEQFAAYRPFEFAKSERQTIADRITLVSVLFAIVFLVAVTSFYLFDLARAIPLRNQNDSRNKLPALPSDLSRQLPILFIVAAFIAYLATYFEPPNGLSPKDLAAIKEIFETFPQFFQPEPRERLAYLTAIVVFPLLALGLISWARRQSPNSATEKLSDSPFLAWCFFLLTAYILFAAKESPFGFAFGFLNYNIIQVLGTANLFALAGLFIIGLTVFCLERFASRKIISPLSRLADFAAIALILFFSAHLSFIPEDTGALSWAPDLIHMAPLFEPAASAFLTQATAGATMVSQYGGLVEFARPLLWAFGGDPLALMWFAFLALAGAALCQWLAIRRISGHPLWSLVVIVAIFYLTGIKYANFVCFQCANFRWFWPSVFLLLAAYHRANKATDFLPYVLIPIAIYWNTETGLASGGAWIGWRFLANAAPLLANTANRRPWQDLAIEWAKATAAFLLGTALVTTYVLGKSGHFLNLDLVTRFAKDFYLYGFYMLPMPAIHLWNIFALIAGALLAFSIHSFASDPPPNSAKSQTQGFIAYCCLLFSLVFSYYQGRSYYGNLLVVSYPLWLAIAAYIAEQRQSICRNGPMAAVTRRPIMALGIFCICFGFAAALTTRFYLAPMAAPFSIHHAQDKKELRDWIKQTSGGRPPLFISFSAWRLQLISGTSTGSEIVPLAAMLRKDQLHDYLEAIQSGRFALYYDRNNEAYFAKENITWIKALKSALPIEEKEFSSRPSLSNSEADLVLLN